VVGDNALLRFYVLHVVGLPLAAFLLMVSTSGESEKMASAGGFN